MHPGAVAVERFTVEPREAGLRVETVLRHRYPGISRRLLAEVFRKDGVRVDSRLARKGDRLVSGQQVEVRLPPEDRAHPNPDLPLVVVAETEDWVIVDKPPKMPSIAQGGDDRSSLASALVARYPAMAGFGYHPREAGLVHRLDNDTTGCVLAAKHEAAFLELREALRTGRIDKRYLAVSAVPSEEEGTIRGRLEADPKNTRRVRLRRGTARHASTEPVTRYRVLRVTGALALLEVNVSTAYRHQIRAHLASIGCPLVGDRLYGSRILFSRHALHAERLASSGSAAMASFDVSTSAPRDLLELVAPA